MYLLDGLESLFQRHGAAPGDVLRFSRLAGGEVLVSLRRGAPGDAAPRTRRPADAPPLPRAAKVVIPRGSSPVLPPATPLPPAAVDLLCSNDCSTNFCEFFCRIVCGRQGMDAGLRGVHFGYVRQGDAQMRGSSSPQDFP